MNKYVERVRRDERGFTLIELLIVIVILAILAGIVIFAVGGITDRGTASACKTDLKTIEVAVEAHYAKTGTYPTNLVPSLTSGANVFLRWDPAFTGSTSATGPATSTWQGKGYTILYDSASHQVWAAPGDPGTPTATTVCPT